jgi:PKHD-type hydroxylase
MIQFETPTQDISQVFIFDNPFNDQAITKLEESLKFIEYQKTKIYDNENIDRIRVSNVKWISSTTEFQYVYESLSSYINIANRELYNFDITSAIDDIQYTEYNGGEKGHYGWHVDVLPNSKRKLSVVVQLSSPDEYEGGDLEVLTSIEPYKIPKKKGQVVVFPTFMLHRVTPITHGLRKSLVWWVGGSPFR